MVDLDHATAAVPNRLTCPDAQRAIDTPSTNSPLLLEGVAHHERIRLRARLTGDFPGSPIELDHIFTLANDKIASLENDISGYRHIERFKDVTENKENWKYEARRSR